MRNSMAKAEILIFSFIKNIIVIFFELFIQMKRIYEKFVNKMLNTRIEND